MLYLLTDASTRAKWLVTSHSAAHAATAWDFESQHACTEASKAHPATLRDIREAIAAGLVTSDAMLEADKVLDAYARHADSCRSL